MVWNSSAKLCGQFYRRKMRNYFENGSTKSRAKTALASFAHSILVFAHLILGQWAISANVSQLSRKKTQPPTKLMLLDIRTSRSKVQKFERNRPTCCSMNSPTISQTNNLANSQTISWDRQKSHQNCKPHENCKSGCATYSTVALLECQSYLIKIWQSYSQSFKKICEPNELHLTLAIFMLCKTFEVTLVLGPLNFDFTHMISSERAKMATTWKREKAQQRFYAVMEILYADSVQYVSVLWPKLATCVPNIWPDGSCFNFTQCLY